MLAFMENAYGKEKEENSKKKVKDKEGHSQTQLYNFTLSPYFVG